MARGGVGYIQILYKLALEVDFSCKAGSRAFACAEIFIFCWGSRKL